MIVDENKFIQGAINLLAKNVHNNAKHKGFHNPTPSFPEILALIHSEISEALEAYRNCEQLFHRVNGKPEGAAVELADAFIRILDWAGSQPGLNFGEIVIEKHLYNLKRPYKHGGKKI